MTQGRCMRYETTATSRTREASGCTYWLSLVCGAFEER